jgi:histone H3/H4
MPDAWKSCSSCKKPIPYGGKYYTCSVSTCNTARLSLVFCSMACWDAHVPTLNHRPGVWANELKAPAAPSAPSPSGAAPAERRIVRPTEAAKEPEEVLIIASRLKDFVREKSDFNTSADVLEALSELVREATVDAIAHARTEGRRTVMARDFQRR